MAGRQVILLAVTAVSMAVVGVRATPTIGDCTHNLHCEPHDCCLVGFNRYSIPSCFSRASVGTPCSPAYSTPFSRTLSYPNGATVEIEEAYFGMCPCLSGLVCISGTCQVPDPTSVPSSSFDNNSVSSEHE